MSLQPGSREGQQGAEDLADSSKPAMERAGGLLLLVGSAIGVVVDYIPGKKQATKKVGKEAAEAVESVVDIAPA